MADKTTSPDRADKVVKSDAQWRRRTEAESGLCIAESLQVVERALLTCPGAVRVVVVRVLPKQGKTCFKHHLN